MRYDYLIVGAGLYGSVFACEANKRGKRCLVIDKRNHIGGNVYTKEINGILVHQYGAHIFHTSNKMVWDYVNELCEFNNFINSPIANYNGEIYNLPFNMNTFSKLWGISTPQEAMAKIEEQKKEYKTDNPKNLEEQAINLVGIDIYMKMIKGYTEKQWGRDCTELPPFIIRRLPLRFTYDNNYFNDRYQGVPEEGYTKIIETLLDGIDVELEVNFFEKYRDFNQVADKLVFTGMIDEFYEYRFGVLEYRSLRFEQESLATDNYQGVAVVNYTDRETPLTRIIEHKHFAMKKSGNTIITREYPADWKYGDEPYYPVNDEKNNKLFGQYRELVKKEDKIIFGGRLGNYKYYDMDIVIANVLEDVRKEFGK